MTDDVSTPDAGAPTEAPIDDSFDIAVIGMACRVPGAPDVDAFWRVLRDGTECIRAFTDAELLAMGVPRETLRSEGFIKAAAVLDHIDRFDAAFFGYSPREAELMDPQHRLFLECAWEALERAGSVPDTAGTVGVFAGAGLSTYLLFNLLARPDLAEAADSFQIMIGNDKDFLATRLAYLLDLRGPSLTVQTGCSTSLVAVHLACQSLLGYQCDVAIAGGSAVQVPQRTGYHYQAGGIASPDGHCRPFDADGAGTIFGSGVGVVVLKRLASAVADGDHIHAVIKGSAINNDGSAKLGYTAPSVDGQVEVITRAQAMAGVAPDAIGFVEAHGTATALGDPVEVEALHRVFAPGVLAPASCALGSVKSNIGHLDAAAGVTSLIKAALAVEHGEIPPTLHIARPNPAIAWDGSPFFVNAERRAWRPGVRRAGVSSFGIGGTNAHVVLEQAPPRAPSGPSRPHQLLVLSAKSRASLDGATQALADHLEAHPEINLADVAHTLQVGRRALPYRRAVVVRDRDDAVHALRDLPAPRTASPAAKAEARHVVFMFPGGGAQHLQMAAGLYAHEPVFRAALDACAALLAPRIGAHLRDVVYPASAELKLTATAVALPALFAVEYALAQLWMSWGIEPEAMIGHSMGEYVAACVAGVFSLADALALVAERGRLFERAPRGAMLNVELEPPQLRAIAGDRALSIAAVNGPGQCVVAGDDATIEGLAGELAARGIEARRVHIDVAAHSHMIEPIMPAFAAFVGTLTLSPPARRFMSCVTGAWITDAEATSVDYWVQHLRQTVRFGDGVAALLGDPRRILLEVGPGRTLSSLARQQLAADSGVLALTSLRSPLEDRADTEVILATLAKLWAAGAAVDLARVLGDERRQRVLLPTYAWDRQRYWLDPDPASMAARAVAERREVADWLSLPSWRRALAPVHRATTARWLVFVEPSLGAHVAAQLAARGHEVITVRPGTAFRAIDDATYEIDAASEDGCGPLFAELARADRRPARIAYFWSLIEPADDALATARLYSLDALIALGRALDGSATHLTVVARGVEQVSPHDVLRPARALVLGPCRVLPIEQPSVTCALVDVDAHVEPARVVAELEGPAETGVVALRGARRWLQAFDGVRVEAAPAILAADAPPSPALRERGAYLITGGFGGIGLVLARHFAQTLRARLALVARTPLPPREAWAAYLAAHDDATAQRIRAVLDLEACGGEVLVVAADVTDEAQIAEALAAVHARFGALHGVIHAAGIPAGGLIQVKTHDAVSTILGPKVAGALVLDRLLGDAALDFFVVCSSRTATTGDLGQVDHVAANAFLEAFAEDRAHAGRPMLALAWDTWAEVGQAVTTDIPGGMESFRAQLLTHAILPSEGPDIFARALGCRASRLIVSTRTLEVAASESRRLARELLLLSGLASDATATPQTTATGAELERAISSVWSRVLRVPSVGSDDSFFDLGGNSVIALRLLAELKRELGLVLPAAMLFESPTVGSLARRLSSDGSASEALDDRKSRGARRRERLQRRQEGK